MENTEQFEGLGCERRIASMLRSAIRANENGRGREVFGIQARTTIRFRIYQARMRNNKVEGRCLNSGRWFVLGGYKI